MRRKVRTAEICNTVPSRKPSSLGRRSLSLTLWLITLKKVNYFAHFILLLICFVGCKFVFGLSISKVCHMLLDDFVGYKFVIELPITKSLPYVSC